LDGEIDWAEVAARSDLTEFHVMLLDNLLDGSAEPTWIVLHDPETGGNREVVEARFRELELRGLVTRSRELSGRPDGEFMELDDWWALTDQGWEVLGLIKPPWRQSATPAR
jgi:hypothetical protein